MELIEQFKRFSDVIIDAYYIVDHEGCILEYNRMFYALFPRSVARKLKGKRIGEVMDIERDIAQECMDAGRHVRLDEMIGKPKESEQEIRMILSGLPLKDDNGSIVGALVILRNVTDEALVQVKYQEMLETEARERQRLIEKLQQRTQQLLDSNDALLDIQRELVNYKKQLQI